MAQSGIHAFTGIILSKFLKYEKELIPSLIFGLILPDIDIIFVVMGLITFKSTFLMHSVFFTTIIYLVFLSLSEITSNKKFEIIGKGISIGILIHIIMDILFWFKAVYLFWPFETNYTLIEYNNDFIINILLALEFILFRAYGWFLVKKYIDNPIRGGWFIKYISKWTKIEFFLFLFFVLLIYLDIPQYRTFFTIMYIPSLIMALISTYILSEVLNH